MTTDKDDNTVVSLSGSPIYRHSEEKDWEAPQGEQNIEAISQHIETHLGPVDWVFHEIISDAVHIDVHIVPPTEAVPFYRLVTSGMSDLPMQVPEDVDAPRHAELMISLPADWQLNQQAFEDENWYWPVRLLKFLARLPHKYETWLGWGHTIPNGDPAEPYASGTQLNGAIILPSVTVPDAFHQLRIDDKEVTFYAVVPLYAEEMQLKLHSGLEALIERLDQAGIEDVIDPQRRSAVRKRLFGLF